MFDQDLQPKRAPVEWFCGNGHWGAPCCFALPPVPLPVVRFGLPSDASHQARQTYRDMEAIEGTTHLSQELSHYNQFLHRNRYQHTSFRVCGWWNVHLSQLTFQRHCWQFHRPAHLSLALHVVCLVLKLQVPEKIVICISETLARKGIFRHLTESYCSILNSSKSNIITDISALFSSA